jgi:aminoglycoside 3-N-acetyltransferase
MVGEEDIRRALGDLALGKASHVLVHTSYKAIAGVGGGPKTVVGALVETLGTVMMPSFTSDRTFVWDQRGAFEGNAYSQTPPHPDAEPEPYTYDTPANRTMGVINETFRTAYPVCRSPHPSASFIAYGALAEELTTPPGTETDGVEPIRRLMEAGGDVLLLGVTHTNSTAIHLGERLAGRPLFVRYATTPEGVVAAEGGGCGQGFAALQQHVEHLERQAALGAATLRAYSLQSYVETVRELVARDLYALLCEDAECARCNAHRSRVPV